MNTFFVKFVLTDIHVEKVSDILQTLVMVRKSCLLLPFFRCPIINVIVFCDYFFPTYTSPPILLFSTDTGCTG